MYNWWMKGNIYLDLMSGSLILFEFDQGSKGVANEVEEFQGKLFASG